MALQTASWAQLPHGSECIGAAKPSPLPLWTAYRGRGMHVWSPIFFQRERRFSYFVNVRLPANPDKPIGAVSGLIGALAAMSWTRLRVAKAAMEVGEFDGKLVTKRHRADAKILAGIGKSAAQHFERKRSRHAISSDARSATVSSSRMERATRSTTIALPSAGP
jgi:hypothetical protein